jgi:hypothetical protein
MKSLPQALSLRVERKGRSINLTQDRLPLMSSLLTGMVHSW